MLSKAKIKLINSLKLGKYRKQHGLFVVEGTTNILDFVKSNIPVHELYSTDVWTVENQGKIGETNIVTVDNKTINKVSFLKNPSEVFGLFQIPSSSTPDLQNINEMVLMLDDIRDPGNLGTIIRTADWFGIRQIICSDESVDAFNPKVVQASMGSLSRVNVHYTDLHSLLKSKPDSLKLFGAVLDGELINEIEKPDKGIILIGNEAHGISKSLIPFVDTMITIPETEAADGSSAESLNASIATAIVCYEFRR